MRANIVKNLKTFLRDHVFDTLDSRSPCREVTHSLGKSVMLMPEVREEWTEYFELRGGQQ